MKTIHVCLRRRFSAARLVLSVILVAVATFGLAKPGQACGPILHLHVLKRALEIIDQQGNKELATLLRENEWQVRYGAVFPDYGYALANDPVFSHFKDTAKWQNYAQKAHEFEFMKAYIEAVKPTFGSSNPEDRKAMAFLFGLIAHNEADNPFHFGGNNFISAALQNDKATANAAVSCLPLGADTGPEKHACTEMQIDLFVRDRYEGYQLFFGWIKLGWIFGDYCTKWDLPESAKTAVITAYGAQTPAITDVTKTNLLDGYNTQITACGIEATSPRVALPWVEQNFLTWPDGGREDMAIQVAAAWQQTWDWFNSTYTPYTEASLSPAATAWQRWR